MRESGYQSKIIKGIIADGGTAITGTLKTGEADIQAGYPYSIMAKQDMSFKPKIILVKLAVEVKTPQDYARVMRGVKEVDGLYEIFNETPLKEHESLQIFKLNNVRKRGGFALIAHSYEQVKEYMNENK